MRQAETRHVLDDLERLLGEERTCLLTGQIDGLDAIARKKHQLFSHITSSGVAGSALEAVRRKADRNQVLLAAATRGIEAARDRVALIRSGGLPMRTYGRDGAAEEMVGTRNSGMNRRA